MHVNEITFDKEWQNNIFERLNSNIQKMFSVPLPPFMLLKIVLCIWNICLFHLIWNLFISATFYNSHETSVPVFLITRLSLTNTHSWYFGLQTTEIASNHQRAQTTWNAPLFDFVISSPVPSSHLSYIQFLSYLFLLFKLHPTILRAFVKLWRPTTSLVGDLCLSVCLNGTTRPPINGFPWNLVFKDLLKICRENSNLVKIWQ